jgi:hypothetical protein
VAPQKRAKALAAEPANVSGLGEDRGGEVGADAVEIFAAGCVLGEEVGDLGVQVGDAWLRSSMSRASISVLKLSYLRQRTFFHDRIVVFLVPRRSCVYRD